MVASGESLSARSTQTGARPMPRRGEPLPWLKPGIFLGALVPLASILLRAVRGELDANPIAQVINELGLASLIILIAGLACTPARWLFGWTWPVRIRRELGLFAFFYAMLHFLTYLALDHLFDWPIILEDIVERPFITVGFLALVVLAPLAVTSTSGWVRRLGYKTWQRLHYLAYVAGVLAIVHFIWRVKIDLTQPLIYAAVLGVLLAVRLVWWQRQRTLKKFRSSRANGPATP